MHNYWIRVGFGASSSCKANNTVQLRERGRDQLSCRAAASPEQRAPMPRMHGGRAATGVHQRRSPGVFGNERRAPSVEASAATGGRRSACLPGGESAMMDDGDGRKQIVAEERFVEGKNASSAGIGVGG
jgi:hypothetical protein